jgi:methyltransferase-like protein/SAM-dependent methyltransferase
MLKQDPSAANTYDAVPYQSHAFSQSQPDKLAVIARLFGLTPVLPSSARVLELGCAAGGNLIPLAARFPNAQFLGIDLSAIEVAHGCQQIERLGLTNIRIEHQSITEFDRAERFDYIIAHGVYSWVPAPVQQAIMKLAQQHLSPDGVAYISYNVYPGWKSREVVRDAMMFHTRAHTDPSIKLQQARGFIQYIEKMSDPKTAFGTMLREEAKNLSEAPDYYVFHEHLEEHNRPCYFTEFAAEAAKHGLGFLGEAAISEMAPQRLGNDIFETLSKLSSGDIIATEQYMDIFKNRMFRQSLLIRREAMSRVARHLNVEKLWPFYASAPAQAVSNIQNSSSVQNASNVQNASEAQNEEVEFRIGPNSHVKTSNSLLKAFMNELSNAYPRPVLVTELRERAWQAVAGQPMSLIINAQGEACDPKVELDNLILRMVIDGVLSLHVEPIGLGRADAPKPKAFSVALEMALRKQTRVPNLRHESINLSTVEIEILALIDGHRDRQQLVEGLVHKSRDGTIRVERDKQWIKDEQVLRPLVENLLKATLEKFERCALLSATS